MQGPCLNRQLRYPDCLAREVLKEIQLIVYDFDGVMTDNKVYVDQKGREMVQVNRADGLGVAEFRKLGIEQMILSTEENPVVNARAKKLNLPCMHGVKDKALALVDYCKRRRVEMGNVAYVGNDINDYEVMLLVGNAFCPTNAHPEIKRISDHVLKTEGGGGVIRELYDFLLNQINKGSVE